MIAWEPLTSVDQLDVIQKDSYHHTILIFKHSTYCSISAIAKMRLEEAWDFANSDMEPYLLDLLTYRTVSNEIAERYAVHHESPQILLIRNGECFHDASHFDITLSEIREVI